MANLFTTAKRTKKTTTAKKEHLRLVPKNVDQDELFESIKEFEQIEVQTKKLAARGDMLKGELKDIALDSWLERYEEDGKNPGSVMIEAKSSTDDVAQFMFVPTDRFLTIRSQEQADELEEKFGEGIVQRETTFSFDPKMLEKYSDVISQLIEDCDEIKDSDKGKLFVATETYKVAPGTLNRLSDFDESVKEVFESVKPVVALKNPQVITS